MFSHELPDEARNLLKDLPPLSDNCKTVLEKRYLDKTDDKQFKEDPDGLFWRVAEFIARPYNEHDGAKHSKTLKFFNLMRGGLFLPNSPTLANAGTRTGQLSACFRAGTMITTGNGPVPIEQIKTGDRVLTHKNHYRPVLGTMTREDNVYRVKVDRLPSMFVTEEHPFLTDKGWVNTVDLKPGDFVKIGQSIAEEVPHVITFAGVEVEEMVYAANTDRRKRSGDISSQIKPIKQNIEVNADVAWFLGMYLAQGSISKEHDIRLTVGMHDTAYANRIRDILYNNFGVVALIEEGVDKKRGHKWVTVRCHSKFLTEWLLANFNKGFDKKSLPGWLMIVPSEVKAAFISGVSDGDGTKINKNQIRITLSNEKLIRQLFGLLQDLGYDPGLRRESMPKLGTTYPWSVYYGSSNPGMVRPGGYYRVKEVDFVEGEKETVYNFEVAEDNTYVANQIVVHNCFVLPVEDALANGKEGIFDTLTKAQLIFQTGGGVGYSFTRLREKGALVNSTKGMSTGPVGYMDVYDVACANIAQGGMRRGAQMGILRVDHPDIMEFIDRKSDLSKLTNFNVSVGVTDAFLAALERGKQGESDDFELVSPSSKKVVQVVSANTIWKRIKERAHATGEPGVVFLDRMNDENPVPRIGAYEATNPCWTGDTKVWTVDGHISFKELAERGADVQVLSQDDQGNFVVKVMRSPRLTRESVEVAEIHLDDGTVLKATLDHNLYLRNGQKVQVQNLKPGDSLLSVYRYKANTKGYLRISNGIESPLYHHVMVSASAGRRPNYPIEHCHHINENKEDNHPTNLEIKLGSDHNSEHMQGELNPIYGVWDERNPLYLIPTDGENNGRYRHDISDQELEALRASGKSFKQIAKEVGCSKYTVMKRLGWIRPEKSEAVVNHKVLKVVRTGEIANVYNGTVDDTHRYFVTCGEHDAILSANCGEQPLAPYESCNLGSIVQDRYIKNGVFDKEKYEADVKTATMFMDNVVDMNEYVPARGHNPGVPEIKETTLKTRKLGLGIMGMARALFKMGLAYDSKAGRAFAEYLFALLDVASKEASIELAKERGAYPYMQENWDECVLFYTRIWEKRIKQAEESKFFDIAERYRALIPQMAQYGMRNSTTTTIAPTGTISIIADTCGGCEPEFSLYTSRWQADVEMVELNPVFVEALKAHNFTDEDIAMVIASVRDRKLGKGSLQLALANDSNLKKLSQEKQVVLYNMSQFFVVAGDISPSNHVLMQASLQKYNDSACSKTINFPEEATLEDVSEAYDLAIATGCKGITIYRDNCRQFQPLTAGAKEEKKSEPVAEPAPQADASEADQSPTRVRATRLFGFNDRIETGDGILHLQVGYDTLGIREVIATVGKAGGVLNGLVEAIGRLVSLALKYKVPVHEIAGQLCGIRSANPRGIGWRQILSIPDAIGKALLEAPDDLAVLVSAQPKPDEVEIHKTVKEAASVGTSKAETTLHHVHDFGESPECPNCGAPMKFGEGCRGGSCTDPSCGYAKC